MVAADDTVELIIPGVGDGDGDGVGDGVGVGVGEAVDVGVGDGDADCACAADIAPTASTSTIAIRRANARPAPILRVRGARDEQRINFIPEKKRPLEKIAESQSAGSDVRPVRAQRQSVTVLTED
jgi:hypothetical protein